MSKSVVFNVETRPEDTVSVVLQESDKSWSAEGPKCIISNSDEELMRLPILWYQYYERS